MIFDTYSVKIVKLDVVLWECVWTPGFYNCLSNYSASWWANLVVRWQSVIYLQHNVEHTMDIRKRNLILNVHWTTNVGMRIKTRLIKVEHKSWYQLTAGWYISKLEFTFFLCSTFISPDLIISHSNDALWVQ